MVQKSFFGMEKPEIKDNKLSAVFARFIRAEPYNDSLFEGFKSLRVLTYSASVETIVKMLNRFETVECVFGYEGVLNNFNEILAWQKIFPEELVIAIKSLDDSRKQFIVEQIAHKRVRFFVVKDAIAHAKIYLLESDTKRRVIVGSANLSEKAFSGKQAETLLVFDDDEEAWEHYLADYETVRESATIEYAPDDLTINEIPVQEIPLIQEVQKAKDGLTVFVNTDTDVARIPAIIRKVEKIAGQYKPMIQPLIKSPKGGQVRIEKQVIGKFIQLVKSQKHEETTEEQTWLSIYRDTGKVLLSGQDISLETDWTQVQSDVNCFVEYFENFKNGFYGDIDQHQKDYFMFMCWFYFSPFVCDLRNHATIHQKYIFDYPLFAILYGKSNCGKTKLIETLMQSMFGHFEMVDKTFFTGARLRGLLHAAKRFPVVFDDVDKKKFTDYGPDIIKDETLILEEYPTFVLSMNADDHSFATEIRKRCLILYTKASLPDNTDSVKTLHNSIMSIRRRLTTTLYHEYLKRVMRTLSDDNLPADMLKFSSEILVNIFKEAYGQPLPAWCTPMTMDDYQGKRYEKVRRDLLKMYETNPSIWEIRSGEIILKLPTYEVSNLRKDIPDWVLREGSKGGSLVLDRNALQEFLGRPFKKKWWLFGR